ncbi:pentatricopeptide repeat-containing protein At5g18950 [Salvia miltiorrhiza]|uniref:pentatricopeptide repeat-containing protein At5g18950 n=1 Tax=Salvia miltiorrhiza TaxID=226208 RepID=UPI0025AC5452|nr:pentatricopeptide repeat-containing protein At5g18950 [Salvia miltiorrhiza]
MARISSIFSNLSRRQNPTSSHSTTTPQIRNRNLCSDKFSINSEDVLHNQRSPIEVIAQDRMLGIGEASAISEELTGKPPNLGQKLAENRVTNASEIAKEVCNVIRTRPKWENTLLSDFPTVSFTDPGVYSEILKQQSDLFLSLQFYLWLRSLDGFLFDPVLCNEMFGRLAEAKDVEKNLLDDREFEVEPWFLELYTRSLCENELIDQVLNVFERLKMIGYCVSLETWNWALCCSVKVGRADAVWKLHEDMVKYGVAPDADTMGCLIMAFCLENNVSKGFELLQQVLKTGHVPDKIVFDNLITALGKNGKYGKVSAVMRKMIVNNCYPDIHTYHEVVRFCRGEMTNEGVRIFNELKKRGYYPDRVMYTTMIGNLCENKDVRGAWTLWFEMIEGGIIPNEFTYNVFVSGLFLNGCVDEAEKLHKEMLDKGLLETTVSFNTRIYGLCINSRVEEARILFEEMNEKGIVRDSMTFNSMIQGFSKQGNAAEAMYFLDELLKQGFEPSSASLASLIEILCDDGHVKEAERIWLDMSEKGFNPGDDALSAIVYGLSRQGQIADMNEWLRHMIQSRVKPKMTTFEKVIECLCGAYRLDDALFVLHYMVKMGYLLKEDTCYSLVDALCKVKSRHVQTLLSNIVEGTDHQKPRSPLSSLLNKPVSELDGLIPCTEDISPISNLSDQSISQSDELIHGSPVSSLIGQSALS